MSWDPVWEKVFATQDWGKYPGEELIRFVARNFYKAPERSKVRLLEIGCGSGANLWFLAREKFCVYGVDGSTTAIQKARKRLDEEYPGWQGELIIGDILKLPFPNDYFDGVIDNEAVCCNQFEDACQIYKELARVTKPGGKMFARTFAKGTWGEGIGEQVGHNAWIVAEGPLAGIGVNRFTKLEEIPELFGSFHIIGVELMVRTMDNLKKEIREWVILGEKRNE